MVAPRAANRPWVRAAAVGVAFAAAARGTALLPATGVAFVHCLAWGTWLGGVAWTTFITGGLGGGGVYWGGGGGGNSCSQLGRSVLGWADWGGRWVGWAGWLV